MVIIFWIFCGIVIILAIIYLIASIEVHNEMKKAKEEELSLTNHNWKKFKNKPWYEQDNI